MERSTPMVETARPRTMDSRALTRDFPARLVTLERPRSIRPKYSAGPNFSASEMIGTAKSIRPTMLNVPATKEPIAAMASAGPARPWRAIWYPSRVVTTDEASPGTFTRIEVVEPPYMVP